MNYLLYYIVCILLQAMFEELQISTKRAAKLNELRRTAKELLHQALKEGDAAHAQNGDVEQVRRVLEDTFPMMRTLGTQRIFEGNNNNNNNTCNNNTCL